MGIIPKPIKKLVCCPPQQWLGRAVMGLTFVCLTSTLSFRFYAEPKLTEGTFVDSDIRATKTIDAIDAEATRLAKERVKQQVIVYRLSNEANDEITKHLEEILKVGDQIRQIMGAFPYLPNSSLNPEVQLYLRSISDAEWQAIKSSSNPTINLPNINWNALQPALNQSETFNFAVFELQHQKSVVSAKAYQDLIDRIEQARQAYKLAKAKLLEGPDMFRDRLLDLTNTEWELDKLNIRSAISSLLSAGIVSGLPEEVVKYRIENLRELSLDPVRRRLAIALLTKVIKPNLIVDEAATAEKVAKAMSSVEPKMVRLQAGEVIVKAGEKITAREFMFLDELGLTQRRTNLVGIAGIAVGTALAMLILALVLKHGSSWLNVRLKLKDLLVIAIVGNSAALAGIFLTSSTLAFFPLASMGLMLGSFYGSRLATLVTALLSGLIAVGISANFITYCPILVGALLAAIITNRPYTRSHLAAAGIIVAVAQAAVFIAIAVTVGSISPFVLVATALQYGASGLIAAIVALGAIPYLEQISYTLTPFRLAELANLDRPLLRRLVTEAPGTFQHTLFVANLAEAAARELGADTTLVRTGTLYHDIGKTLRPEYFIENQMGQTNPHDLLDDPWRSAQMIKEHVSGGIKLAQKYHLPEILQAFIPEHQGTIAIYYFYCKARERSPEISEAEFRYEGPIPQSRETGIVMLADACEAALRSLGNDTTLEKGSEMLMRIFQSRWDDGQLRDSGLTPADMERIAPVFIKIWQERNHGRIKYPALAKKLDPSGSAMPDQACNSCNGQTEIAGILVPIQTVPIPKTTVGSQS
ncbi:HDIG domain-containing metalloprotein [Tumidithrix elongata RA019]|uniref:HDIG domain-containing metalloprotein n=1 Tax=Tumidithrix elongata BACA0141 TaxID=2716417 RepID=A0AAW9Q4R9_9CYAN|nr:HDIG domain-containing metalloprotein [Tumidithrix elongata RA019]